VEAREFADANRDRLLKDLPQPSSASRS
jgi:hypothetical protein